MTGRHKFLLPSFALFLLFGYLFQNCSPTSLNLKSDGNINSTGSVLPGSLGLGSQGEGGNGQGFDGKLFAENVDCTLKGGYSFPRSAIRQQGPYFQLIRKDCKDISPQAVDSNEIQSLDTESNSISYRGHIFLETDKLKSTEPPNLPVGQTGQTIEPPEEKAVASPNPPARFQFEFGGAGNRQVLATRGSEHADGEALAYLAFTAVEGSKKSELKRIAFDGQSAGIIRQRFQSRTRYLDTEIIGGASAMHFVRGSDFDKTVQVDMTMFQPEVAYVRLIGGKRAPTVAYQSDALFLRDRLYGRVLKKQDITGINVKRGDLVFVSGLTAMSSSSSISATGMQKLKSGGFSIWAKSISTDGQFATRLTLEGNHEVWGYLLLVLRPSQ